MFIILSVSILSLNMKNSKDMSSHGKLLNMLRGNDIFCRIPFKVLNQLSCNNNFDILWFIQEIMKQTFWIFTLEKLEQDDEEKFNFSNWQRNIVFLSHINSNGINVYEFNSSWKIKEFSLSVENFLYIVTITL